MFEDCKSFRDDHECGLAVWLCFHSIFCGHLSSSLIKPGTAGRKESSTEQPTTFQSELPILMRRPVKGVMLVLVYNSKSLMKYANSPRKADDAAPQLTSECLEVNKLVVPSLSLRVFFFTLRNKKLGKTRR